MARGMKRYLMCVIEWGAITVLEFAENGLALVYEMLHKVQRSMEENQMLSRCLVTGHLVGDLTTFTYQHCHLRQIT